jgi:hypothetical protein
MRVAGFHWVDDINLYTVSGREHGEFHFVTHESTERGGNYFVSHEEESGDWFVLEFGGQGDAIWDREVGGPFRSPLEAMRFAGAEDRTERFAREAWERKVGLG